MEERLRAGAEHHSEAELFSFGSDDFLEGGQLHPSSRALDLFYGNVGNACGIVTT